MVNTQTRRPRSVARRLPESNRAPTRSLASGVLSVVTHTVLIALTAGAALGPSAQETRAAVERMTPVRFARVVPAAERSAPREAKRGPRGFQVLTVPAVVSPTLPDIDFTRPTTRAEDFTARGIVGGLAPAPVGGPLGGADLVEADDADLKAYLLPDQLGPDYPDGLRSGAPSGLVIVRFVVDTVGRVEPLSLDVRTASHRLFAESVRTALERLRFAPAEFAGRKIRVRVEQRFEFHLASR
jgi:TonB family protein